MNQFEFDFEFILFDIEINDFEFLGAEKMSFGLSLSSFK